MKTIQPVKVWYNGAEIDASVLNAFIQSDNLKDTATFQYQLMALLPTGMNNHVYPISIVTSYITITGEDYEKWDTNDYAYNWIASKLNLIITGEYVFPTPTPVPDLTPTPEPTPEPTPTAG